MTWQVNAKQPESCLCWNFCFRFSLPLPITCVLGGSGEPGAQKFQHCLTTRVKLENNMFVIVSFCKQLPIQGTPSSVPHSLPLISPVITKMFKLLLKRKQALISPQGTGTVTSLPFKTRNKKFKKLYFGGMLKSIGPDNSKSVRIKE